MRRIFRSKLCKSEASRPDEVIYFPVETTAPGDMAPDGREPMLISLDPRLGRYSMLDEEQPACRLKDASHLT